MLPAQWLPGSGLHGGAARLRWRLQLQPLQHCLVQLRRHAHTAPGQVGHLVLHRHAQHLGRLGQRQPIGLAQPLQHARGGDAQRIIAGAPLAQGHDLRCRFHPRRCDRMLLQQLHFHHHIQRCLQRPLRGFAIALERMAITQVHQGTRLLHGQVDRIAFDHGVEVHVAAEVTGIAGGERRVAEARRQRQAAEHRLHRHFEMPQATTCALRTGDAPAAVQLPAHRLAQPGGFGSHPRRLQAPHQAIQAVGVVTVERQRGERDRQRVAGFGADHEKRPDLWIAEQRAGDALLVDAAGVQRAGLYRVPRPDHQHRRTVGAEGIGIVSRREHMALRCGRNPRRYFPGAEGVDGTRLAVVGVRLIALSLHPRPVNAPVELVALALAVGCGEYHLPGTQGAGDRVGVQTAGDTPVLHVHLQGLVVPAAPQVGGNDPLFGSQRIQGQQRQQHCRQSHGCGHGASIQERRHGGLTQCRNTLAPSAVSNVMRPGRSLPAGGMAGTRNFHYL
ncbi:hypothetical protein BN1263540016 [Stenotrophomonas indicatrix]|nr:hypothetical protein BN1263540016 [Stenotrophomonas indicatrix]